MNTLLEKADHLYKQLTTYRPTLEALLMRVTEQGQNKLQVRRNPLDK